MWNDVICFIFPLDRSALDGLVFVEKKNSSNSFIIKLVATKSGKRLIWIFFRRSVEKISIFLLLSIITISRNQFGMHFAYTWMTIKTNNKHLTFCTKPTCNYLLIFPHLVLTDCLFREQNVNNAEIELECFLVFVCACVFFAHLQNLQTKEQSCIQSRLVKFSIFVFGWVFLII